MVFVSRVTVGLMQTNLVWNRVRPANLASMPHQLECRIAQHVWKELDGQRRTFPVLSVVIGAQQAGSVVLAFVKTARK